MPLEKKLIDIILTNEHVIEDLKLVRGLELPDCWIAAGYVRNYVWDAAHGYKERTLLNDVDIIYFDSSDLSVTIEVEAEKKLQEQKPHYNWSVKNQARMHIRNESLPYTSTMDAMRYWPETATAAAICMDGDDHIHILAPHGLEDLLELKIRKSKFFKDKSYFLKRIKSKKWLEIWPMLQLLEDE